MAPDEITTGELGRRMDEVRDDVRELLNKFNDLDTKFVPRAELDERHRRDDQQFNALEVAVAANRRDIAQTRSDGDAALTAYKTDVAAARRWAIGTAVASGLTIAALVANALFH